jgi:hypothetical protein
MRTISISTRKNCELEQGVHILPRAYIRFIRLGNLCPALLLEDGRQSLRKLLIAAPECLKIDLRLRSGIVRVKGEISHKWELLIHRIIQRQTFGWIGAELGSEVDLGSRVPAGLQAPLA